LHYAECRAYCAGYPDVVRRLKKHLPAYDKTRLDFRHYAAGVADAVKRAKDLDPSGTAYHRNPSTSMWQLSRRFRNTYEHDARAGGDPAVRGHQRRRDGAAELHPAVAARPASRSRGPAARGEDGDRPPAGGARPGDRGGAHLLRHLRPGVPPGRSGHGGGAGAGVPTVESPGGQRDGPPDPAAQTLRGGRLRGHGRAYRRHRRHPQPQGRGRGEGAGVLPGAEGHQPGRPGAGARPGPGRAGRARRRDPGVPGGHPARRPPAQHPGGRRRGAGGVPATPAAAGGGRPPVRRADGRGPGSGPRVRAGDHPQGGGELPRARGRRAAPVRPRADQARAVPAGGVAVSDPRLGTTVTHRRYVPYSRVHYGGNLVDGAYALALFGDVATELCIRTDGDEGMLAGYSDVRFTAPIRAGDVVEVTGTVTRVGNRSRTVELSCAVVCRARPERSPSAAEVL